MQKTDEQIAIEIQNGDKNAFAEIVDRYEEKIRRYTKRMIFDQSKIDDLTQDIFIKSYININSFDTKQKFSSWIYRIAHNESVNLIKKTSLQNLLSIDFDTILPLLPSKENTEEKIEKEMTKNMVEKVMNSLDEKYKEPLTLFYLEEFSYEEISKIMSIPEATVGVRINRGRKKLKEIYEKEIKKYERN